MKNARLQVDVPQSAAQRRSTTTKALMSLFLFSMAAVFSFFATGKMSRTNAATTDGFNPGNIISDAVMGDYTTMTVEDIQNFLNSKNSCNNRSYQFYEQLTQRYPHISWHWDDGHFICLSEERFGDGIEIGTGQTAAEIIYEAAQDYKINPQVLLVLLEKEQGLISDDYPNSIQYRSATGYGCPDTAECDTNYYGFKNQIRHAANLFRYTLDNGYYAYPEQTPGVQIRFHPNVACGATEVWIENRATAALYRYTPYQPNTAALRANYGTGDGCSAYGNRNFYLFFVDWFGDPHDAKEYTDIDKVYQELGGADSVLGERMGNLEENATTGIYYIEYQNGFIVGNSTYGYYVSTGKIREVWKAQNFESGSLGFPISNIDYNAATGIYYQEYQGGFIVGNDNHGYYISSGEIREVWRMQNFESGSLGFPITNIDHNATTGIYYQQYENGYIVGNSQYGYYISDGDIREVWKAQNFESGPLGFPVSNTDNNANTGIYYQEYQNGFVVGNDEYGYYVSAGGIREVWKAQNFESGELGFPVSTIEYNASTGIYYQQYENGYIVGNDTHGYHISAGRIRDIWEASDFERGYLGFPTSNIVNSRQYYQNGFIDCSLSYCVVQRY